MTEEKKINIKKTDAQWQEQLSEEAYQVTRKHGTERAFTHPYESEKTSGSYNCICCGEALFTSDSKFNSGTGWPSYFQPASPSAISEYTDKKLFATRTEVRCANCDAHLGHVFPDGPQPTGLRYCINGAALDLKKDK